MIDFTALNTGIVAWILAQTGKAAIQADQNGPKPDNPYFAFRITSIMRVGIDELSTPDAGGLVKIKGNRDFTLQLLGFGDGIVSETEKARSSLQNPFVTETLKAAGLTYFDDTAVNDISGLDESEFEERSQCDIFMRTCNLISDVDAGFIEIVNGEATYKQAGKSDIIRNYTIDSTT